MRTSLASTTRRMLRALSRRVTFASSRRQLNSPGFAVNGCISASMRIGPAKRATLLAVAEFHTHPVVAPQILEQIGRSLM